MSHLRHILSFFLLLQVLVVNGQRIVGVVTDAETGDNVVGKVFINGPMEYSSVREGDEVIAEKIPYEDHHRFYYVTAMYTKRK